MNKKIIIQGLLLLTGALALSANAWAASALSLTKEDRVLILAPHPDDEAIGTGGVIQRAVALGIPLKILYLTHGDNNELAFWAYKKLPVLSRKGLLTMGELRHQEAIAAMNSLGVRKEQLVFLGYPDQGMTELFTKYWGGSTRFKSMLTRVTAVPYQDTYSYKAPYTGESALNDIKKVLLDFRPTKIFVTLPVDTNVDHRAYYLFLQTALWDLEGKIPAAEIYPYIVHIIGWPLPRGFHPELSLDIPQKLRDGGLDWFMLDLSPQEIENKKEAIGYYKSQEAYNPKYLYTFARKNELFGRFKDIVLKEDPGMIDWEQYEASEKILSHLTDDSKPHRNIIRSVAFAQQDNKLLIRLAVNNWESELGEVNLFLIGYKKGLPFAAMPKVRVHINFDHFIVTYDKLSKIAVKDLKFSHQKDLLLIEFPLESLGGPEKILSSVNTYLADWPLEATAWRTLIVDRGP